jgi:RNA polymerase sigma-70 factor (ECF subfamily)
MADGRTDAALLSAIGGRDMDAMRELYSRHAGWLAVRLGRRCNDAELVADAVGDTFVAIWQRPGGFRGEGEVAAWIWGIAIRRLISRLRRHRDVLVATEPSTAQAVPGAEEQVLLSVEYGQLGRALDQLSPQMRAVIQAVVLDGLTTKEAARLLHLPQGTVKTRLARAKVRLRSALAEGSP